MDTNNESPLSQDVDFFDPDYDFEVTPSPIKNNTEHLFGSPRGSRNEEDPNALSPRTAMRPRNAQHTTNQNDFTEDDYDDELKQMEAEFALHLQQQEQSAIEPDFDDLFSPQIQNDVMWEYQNSTGVFVSENDISGKPDEHSLLLSEHQILTIDQIQFQDKLEHPDDYLFDINVDHILTKRGTEIRRALDIVPMLGSIQFSPALIQKLNENQVLHLMRLSQVLLEIRHQEFLAERDERIHITRKVEEFIHKKSESAIPKSPRTTRQQNQELFNRMDVNQDGFITPGEFKDGMRENFGMELSDEHLKHILDEADLNKDKKIDFHEFHGLMEMLDAEEDDPNASMNKREQLQKEREEALLKQLKKLEGSITELTKDKAEVEARASRLEQDLNDSLGYVQFLNDKYAPLEEAAFVKDQELKQLEMKNIELKEQIVQLNMAKASLEKELAETNQERTEGFASVSPKVRTPAKSGSHSTDESAHHRDAEKMAHMEQEIGAFKSKLAQLEVDLQSKEQKSVELLAENFALQQSHLEAQQQLTDKTHLISHLSQQLSAQDAHHATQQEFFNSTIATLEEQVAHMQKQLESAFECVPSLTFDVAPLFGPMDLITPARVGAVQTARLQNQLKELETDLENAQYDAHVYKKERDVLSAKNQHQSQAMRHYKSLVASLENKIAESDAERDLASTKLKDLLQMLRAKEESLERLGNVIPAYEERISVLLKDVARLKRQTQRTIKSNNQIFQKHVAEVEESTEMEKILTPHDIVDSKLVSDSSKIIINSSRKRQRSRPSSAMSSVSHERIYAPQSGRSPPQRDSIIIRSALMNSTLRPRLSLPKKDDTRQRVWVLPYCNVHSTAYVLLTKKKDERWSCLEGLPNKKQLTVDPLYTIADIVSAQTLGLLSNATKITQKSVEDSLTTLYADFKRQVQHKGKTQSLIRLQVPSTSKKNIDLCVLVEIPYIPVDIFQAHVGGTGSGNVILTPEAAVLMQGAGNLEYAWVKMSLITDVIQRCQSALQNDEYTPENNMIEWKDGELLNPLFAKVLTHAVSSMLDLCDAVQNGTAGRIDARGKEQAWQSASSPNLHTSMMMRSKGNGVKSRPASGR